jgi:hypothetical protein
VVDAAVSTSGPEDASSLPQLDATTISATITARQRLDMA